MKFVSFYLETSGLPVWSKPSDSVEQPHIVRISAKKYDLRKSDSGDMASQFYSGSSFDAISSVVDADWEINKESELIHGISNNMSIDQGFPEANLVDGFFKFVEDLPICSYNKQFDYRILRIALKRFFGEEDMANWEDRKKTGYYDVKSMYKDYCCERGIKCPAHPSFEAAYESLRNIKIVKSDRGQSRAKYCAEMFAACYVKI